MSVPLNILHFNFLNMNYVMFTSQTSMNATWSTTVAVYTSAPIYQAIIAALVMTDSIWHMTDTTVSVSSALNH